MKHKENNEDEWFHNLATENALEIIACIGDCVVLSMNALNKDGCCTGQQHHLEACLVRLSLRGARTLACTTSCHTAWTRARLRVLVWRPRKAGLALRCPASPSGALAQLAATLQISRESLLLKMDPSCLRGRPGR